MIGHIQLGDGTTFCPDTPENWRHFERKKAALQTGNARVKPTKSATSAELNRALQQQTVRENKALRSLRSFLPGYEPDAR